MKLTAKIYLFTLFSLVVVIVAQVGVMRALLAARADEGPRATWAQFIVDKMTVSADEADWKAELATSARLEPPVTIAIFRVGGELIGANVDSPPSALSPSDEQEQLAS